MLDSFAVTSKFSKTQANVLRLSVVLAAVAIAIFNYISTCSPNYETTYSDKCDKTLLPSGAQLSYDQFTMATQSQLNDYDGFKPQNCTVYETTIQMWFTTKNLPTHKVYMNVGRNHGIDLSVLDIKFKFWHENYEES
ncbi:hypothetical protein BGZ83_006971 [Gryganskiella cystojenkinii]|nr:hypothetical protein BGZ83_006971 [Gryganskiella cystojenkinii]